MATQVASSRRGLDLYEPPTKPYLGEKHRVSAQDPSDTSLDAHLGALRDYPEKYESSLCWTAASLSEHQHIILLSALELNSVECAVTYFKSLSLPIAQISPETFPLMPVLVERLRDISNTLHNGVGFSVLRGWSSVDRSDEDNVIAFAGIVSHIGSDRSTNDYGMSLEHLRDAAKDAKPEGKEHVELSQAKIMAPLKFHADRDFADNVALFVKSPAAVGGNQYLASFGTVFNELRSKNPEALETLARDFPWPGVRNDEPVTTYTPVMFKQKERIFCQIFYRVFEKSDILSKAQWNALGAMEKIANETCIELLPKAGDMQFFNNLALLHARRAWIDRPGKERHYYRMGFRDPEFAWERPPQYAWLFDARFEVPVTDQTIPFTDYDPYGLTSLGEQGHG